MVDDGKRIYDRNFETLGRYLDEISLSGRKDKVIGFMPTCFSYRCPLKRPRFWRHRTVSGS